MSIVTAPQLPTDLPEEDGVPLESEWHRLDMTLLIELVGHHLRGRDDYYVGGNMFIYFDPQQARHQNFRGPDFFFVWETSRNPLRKYWAVWDEGGKYPDVIIELSSPTTADEDEGRKKRIYEKVFHTSEYFIYDPDDQQLKGWRLDSKQRYRKIQPNAEGRLWCDQLGLFLGTWNGEYQGKKGVYLRFFDKNGNMIPAAEERAETAEERAETAEERAGTAEECAETAVERAKTAEQRAEAAEAELARLRAKLKESEQ